MTDTLLTAIIILMTYIIIATVVTLAVAAAGRFLGGLSWLPVGVFAAIASLVINPLTFMIGMNIAKADAVTFNEYWNGYESAAIARDITCVRDGYCSHTYSCDPYQVPVTKSRSVPDGSGGTKTEYYTEMETRWHSCPYSTQETSYYVDDTLGQRHTIAASLMTGDKFRSGKSIPGGRVTEIPELWAEAKARIDAGKPGPVTSVNTYPNYILASQTTLFKNYEGEIESLKAEGLLPAPASGVTTFYRANKVYNVANALGGAEGNAAAADYSTDVAYLNGAVGSDLRGDLHMVFVPENVTAGPDGYMNSLMAYWQSEEMGRNAVSKNGIIILIGVNSQDNTVAWARAATGMPIGNEGLLQEIRSDLPGTPLDENFIGRPTMNLANETIVHTDGVVENMLWGENAFERVSMSGDGVEGAGFSYLESSIQIDSSAFIWIAIANFILVALAAGGAIAWNENMRYSYYS